MLNKKSIIKFELISTFFIILLGVLFHFIFELTDNNVIVGLFAPVNESIWEHLKLIFFPMIIQSIIGYIYKGKEINNYFWAKTQGIIFSMIFVVIFYYTYTGIIGKNIDFINIGSYCVAIILGQYYSLKKMNNNDSKNLLYVVLILIVISFYFIIFTFNPPKINLFKDPITNTFGIKSLI